MSPKNSSVRPPNKRSLLKQAELLHAEYASLHESLQCRYCIVELPAEKAPHKRQTLPVYPQSLYEKGVQVLGAIEQLTCGLRVLNEKKK